MLHADSPTQPGGPAAGEQIVTWVSAQGTGPAVAAGMALPGPAAVAGWGFCWEGTAPHLLLAPVAWP